MLNDVKFYLEQHKITYIVHHHKPIFSSKEEGEFKNIPGVHLKNLVLKDQKSGAYYMYTLPAHERANLKELARIIGEKHLSFVNEKELWDLLRIKPGHVSPLCLIHNTQKHITLLIDQRAWDADIVGFHPNENDKTLEVDKENFHKLISTFTQEKHIVNVPHFINK